MGVWQQNNAFVVKFRYRVALSWMMSKVFMKTSTPHLLCDRLCFTIRCAVVTPSVLAVGHETWRREKVDQRRNHGGKIGCFAGVLWLAMGSPAIAETTSVFMPGPCRSASQPSLSQLLLSKEREGDASEPEPDYVESRDGIRCVPLNVDRRDIGVERLLLSERTFRKEVTTPNGNKDSAVIELGPSIGPICRTATHHRDRATGNGLDSA